MASRRRAHERSGPPPHRSDGHLGQNRRDGETWRETRQSLGHCVFMLYDTDISIAGSNDFPFFFCFLYLFKSGSHGRRFVGRKAAPIVSFDTTKGGSSSRSGVQAVCDGDDDPSSLPWWKGQTDPQDYKALALGGKTQHQTLPHTHPKGNIEPLAGGLGRAGCICRLWTEWGGRVTRLPTWQRFDRQWFS